MVETIECAYCGATVLRDHLSRRYCSRQCAVLFKRERTRSLSNGTSAGKSTIGAAAELLVAADLLRRGYHVYRALSNNAACDLVVFLGDDPPVKVEVKVGRLAPSGVVSVGHVKDRHDLLAVVLHDGSIRYTPALQSG